MVKKYDPVIDFTAFSKLRDELGKGFDNTRDPASARRLEEVGEEIGDALTRGFSELFGRVTQTASQSAAGQPATTDRYNSGTPDSSHAASPGDFSNRPWQPNMDSHESTDSYTLVFELAGVNPSAVEMELAGNTLTLSGHVAVTNEAKDFESGFSGQERRSGAFERSVKLPADALTDELTASAEHGLLTVSIPKQQSLKPRKITIASAD